TLPDLSELCDFTARDRPRQLNSPAGICRLSRPILVIVAFPGQSARPAAQAPFSLQRPPTMTMPPLEPDDHGPGQRRSSFRCSVDGERGMARLKIGDRAIDVDVLDESAGGFAVAVDTTPDCAVGDFLLLEVAQAWVEVRVVNIGVDPDGIRARLGLMRLR